VAALLVLVERQAGTSWMPGGHAGAKTGAAAPDAAPPVKHAAPPSAAFESPAPAATAVGKPSPLAALPAADGAPKPGPELASPAGAAAASPAPIASRLPDETAAPGPAPVLPAEPAEVTVITSPAGATATLDGRRESACSTPCTLDAAPGSHTVSIAMAGYQSEQRRVAVGSGPIELPMVILHSTQGTLLVTSTPAGAAITINGKRMPQTTPAQIPLPPGSYRVVVEKDGVQHTSALEIRNGETKLLKLSLNQ